MVNKEALANGRAGVNIDPCRRVRRLRSDARQQRHLQRIELVRHAVIDHRAYARVAMQDLGTAAGRRVSRKRRGDIPLDQRANGGELGGERVHDAINLIWSEPLTWSLSGEEHGAASDLLAQSGERRR